MICKKIESLWFSLPGGQNKIWSDRIFANKPNFFGQNTLQRIGKNQIPSYRTPPLLSLCSMCYETFFPRFLSRHLKKLRNIIASWKKYIFYHFDYFPGCSAHFWPLESPKMRQCPYLNNRWSYEVLWPLILSRTSMFLTYFILTSKMSRSSPKTKKW